jgi:enoyl-CoA hydratase/carnithine racemase
MNNSIVISEIATQDDVFIGQITLNKPQALNALDAQMTETMLMTLLRWRERSDIVAVLIHSAGDKAFCAGGDIVSLYHAMVNSTAGIPAQVQHFFELEYRLDYLLHRYEKPIILWGDGIVMGGGMGLFCGASHRLVTERTRLAMPEISIGLYPDVGGSYFLPRLSGHAGLFIGLTGAQLNPRDAVDLGLCRFVVPHQGFAHMLMNLKQAQWRGHKAHDVATDICFKVSQLNVIEDIPAQFQPWRQAIDLSCSHSNIAEVAKAILAINGAEDPWLLRAQKTLQQGSPLSAHLIFQQYQRGAQLTLSECFQMELNLSCRCGEFGEFQEGVRALLIDKDKQPHWHYPDIESVPTSIVDGFFQGPWPQHPLADLGRIR